MKPTLSLIIIGALLLSGCLHDIPPIGEYTENKIGHPIEKQKMRVADPGSYASRIGWQEKTYKLDNGNWVYVEPDSKNCFIHWEVNPEGTIIGYKLDGNCR
jgi:hypothetical protein